MIPHPVPRTPKAKSLAQVEADFTSEGAPPPDNEAQPVLAPEKKAARAARRVGNSVDQTQKSRRRSG